MICSIIVLCAFFAQGLTTLSGWRVGCGVIRMSCHVVHAQSNRAVQTDIAKVQSIEAVETQVVAVGEKIVVTRKALDGNDLSSEKRVIAMMELNKVMDEMQSLMNMELSLMNMDLSLMDMKAKLMDEEAKERGDLETTEGVLTIPAFHFDVASWQPGSTIDCSELSVALGPFACFSSTVYVREEMLAVWSIVVDGIAVDRSKWVIVGFPGVGTSVLTVLMCFHLARTCNKAVFLARQLKGEDDVPLRSCVPICFHPGGSGLPDYARYL